jgi:RNase P/RNase MRP subunit p29
MAQGGHSAASARKNVASKLEGRTLQLAAFRKKPTRTKASSGSLLAAAAVAAPLSLSKRALKRMLAAAPPELFLAATTREQAALLTHEFDAYFAEACALAGCAHSGSSSNSSGRPAGAGSPIGAPGGRSKADRQAAVLAQAPLFGARLVRVEAGQAPATAAPAAAAAPVALTVETPEVSPPEDLPATAAAPAAASGSGRPTAGPRQRRAALSGVVVGESRNAWTLRTDDPTEADGAGKLRLVVKAGATFALTWRGVAFTVRGSTYVGRLSGQPPPQAPERGEGQATPSGRKRPRLKSSGKKRPASELSRAGMKFKVPKRST